MSLKIENTLLGLRLVLGCWLLVTSPCHAQGLPGKDSSNNPRLIARSLYSWPYATQGFFTPHDSQYFLYPNATTKLPSPVLDFRYDPNSYHSGSFVYSYDGSGRVLKIKNTRLDRLTNTWNNEQQFFYIYSSTGKQLSELSQMWNKTTFSWENYSQVINTYDFADNLIQIQNMAWRNGQWQNTSQILIVYNGQGNYTNMVSQQWQNGAWLNTFSKNLIYDAYGRKLITKFYKRWDDSNLNFFITGKDAFTYNATGQVFQEFGYGWDTATHAEINSHHSMVTNTYDTSGNLIERKAQSLSIDTLNYISDSKYTATYNTHNQVLTENTYIAVNNVFTQGLNCYRYNYYYNEAPTHTSINKIQNGGALLAVYPNPTANELHISLKWNEPQAFSVTLTDMAGRIFTSITVPPIANYVTILSTEHLPSGNYLLTIRGNNGDGAVQKVMVKH